MRKLPTPSQPINRLTSPTRRPIPSPSRKIAHAVMAPVTGMEIAMAIIAAPAAATIIVVPAVTASTVAVVRQTKARAIMAQAVSQVVAAGAGTKAILGTILVVIMPVVIMAAGNTTGITVMGTADMSSPIAEGAEDSTAAIIPAGSITDIMVTSSLIGVDVAMAVAVDTNMVTTLAVVITVIGATNLPIMADADRTTVIMPTDIIAVMSSLTAVVEATKVTAGTVTMRADGITVIVATNSHTVADTDVITVITPTAGITAIVGTSSLIGADEGTTDMDTAVTNTVTMPAADITATVVMSLLIAATENTTDIMVTNSPTAAVTAASDMVRITSATTATGLLITADGVAADVASVI